jgi:hypothetical protein
LAKEEAHASLDSVCNVCLYSAQLAYCGTSPSGVGGRAGSYVTGVLDADDELNLSVPSEASGHERRDQLLAYLLEIRG